MPVELPRAEAPARRLHYETSAVSRIERLPQGAPGTGGYPAYDPFPSVLINVTCQPV
jgi:hypothetical protein